MGVPKCPRSEIAYGTKNTSYIYNTVESCKSACEDSDTCNMVSRYGGWVGRNGHCYVYSCPDPSNITWVKQTSFGHGADSASTYKLMDRLVTPLVNPPEPPTDPAANEPSTAPTAAGVAPTTAAASPTTGATAPTTAASSPTTAAASPTSGDTAPTTAASSPTTAATAPTTAAAPTATRTEVSSSPTLQPPAVLVFATATFLFQI